MNSEIEEVATVKVTEGYTPHVPSELLLRAKKAYSLRKIITVILCFFWVQVPICSIYLLEKISYRKEEEKEKKGMNSRRRLLEICSVPESCKSQTVDSYFFRKIQDPLVLPTGFLILYERKKIRKRFFKCCLVHAQHQRIIFL